MQGALHIKNATLDLDHFPYMPVFTWSDLYAEGRLDINFTSTATGELLLTFKGKGIVKQSLDSKSIKVQKRQRKTLKYHVPMKQVTKN